MWNHWGNLTTSVEKTRFLLGGVCLNLFALLQKKNITMLLMSSCRVLITYQCNGNIHDDWAATCFEPKPR